MHRLAKYAFPSLAATCGFVALDTQAAVIGINDFSGDATVIGFDKSFDPTWSKDLGGATISMTQLTDRVGVSTTNWGGYFSNLPVKTGGQAAMTSGLVPSFSIVFDTPVQQAGLALANSSGFSWTITAFDEHDNQLGEEVFTVEAGYWALFAGLTFETPIARLHILDPGGSDYVTLLDDIRFVVPEPATLALLGLGSMLMAGRVRARQN